MEQTGPKCSADRLACCKKEPFCRFALSSPADGTFQHAVLRDAEPSGYRPLLSSPESGRLCQPREGSQGNRVKPIKSFLRTAITLWVMSARRSVLLSESRLKN